MKKLVFLIFCFYAGIVSGQDSKFLQVMKDALQKLDSAKTLDDMQNSANQFERIAVVETNNWLPYYYASYCHAVMTFLVEKKNVKDDLCDKALVFITKADSLNANNSEIYTMHGFALQTKMLVNPMARGRTLGPESGRYFNKAIELNPENPRPYYLTGQSLFYTPKQFGGGKEVACPLLEKAVQKYENFIPESNIHPNWGKELAAEIFTKCIEKDDATSEEEIKK